MVKKMEVKPTTGNLREIRKVKEAVEAELLTQPGVTGVDIGYKYVDGEKTDELAIRVLVEEKKDVKDIPEKEKIPNMIKGVKTDVIQRKFVLHPLGVRLADLERKTDTGTYDPLKGGISIGPCRSVYLTPPDVDSADWYVFVGTLGAIVKDDASGDRMLLSNFHVMCVDDGWSVGDTMAQPSRVDGGSCPADVVGELQRASLGGKVDCAVASHTTGGYSCSIVDIGNVTGTATAAVGMAVRKRGRTTELTYGTVDTVDLTVKIDYGNGLGDVTLTNQIGIDVDASQSVQFGDHGDSGSVVVNDDSKVVGLYFAGSEDGTYGAANPIQYVLDALSVSLCVPASFKSKDSELKNIKEYELKNTKEYELKNIKEFKESELKNIKEKEFEVPFKPTETVQPIQPVQPLPRGTLEERLGRIEAAIDQMTHFIGHELRPDLEGGALTREPDLDRSDPAALNRRLQKQAADAKVAKDNKDVEKLSER